MEILVYLLLIGFILGQLTRFEIFPGIIIYFHDLIILIIFVLTCYHIIKTIRQKETLPLLLKPILLFFVVASTSLVANSFSFTSKELLVGSLYLIRWISYSSLYFYTYFLVQSKKTPGFFKDRRSLHDLLLMSGIGFSIFGLVQYFIYPDTRNLKWLGWDDHYYRLIGTTLDPGFTGIIIVLTVFILLSQKLSKSFKWIYVLVVITALLLTYSRSSYLAFLVGIFIFFLYQKRMKIFLASSVMFISILFFLPKAQSEGTNLLRLYSLKDRVSNWKNALLFINEKPIFGAGFNTLRYAKRDYGFADNNWQKSHSVSGFDNSFLFIFATSGIIGLLAYLYLLANIVSIYKSNIKRHQNESTLIFCSLAAIIVHSLFNNTLFYPWVMIWFWYLLGTTEASIPQKKPLN